MKKAISLKKNERQLLNLLQPKVFHCRNNKDEGKKIQIQINKSILFFFS